MAKNQKQAILRHYSPALISQVLFVAQKFVQIALLFGRLCFDGRYRNQG
jgi:hypothetical protein